MQRVSSGHGSAIVGNLDSIVQRIQVDAIQVERHFGRVQSRARVVVVTKGVLSRIEDRRGGGVAVHLRSAQRVSSK
jgi:hypothetical protein